MSMTGRNRICRVLALAGTTAWLTIGSADADAQVTRQDFYVTNGEVRSEVLVGNVLYIGGMFTQVGPPTGGGVPLDPTTGSLIGGFPASRNVFPSQVL